MSDDLAGWPAFARELHATLAVHSQYVLWGNIHDSYLVDDRDPAGRDGAERDPTDPAPGDAILRKRSGRPERPGRPGPS